MKAKSRAAHGRAEASRRSMLAKSVGQTYLDNLRRINASQRVREAAEQAVRSQQEEADKGA